VASSMSAAGAGRSSASRVTIWAAAGAAATAAPRRRKSLRPNFLGVSTFMLTSLIAFLPVSVSKPRVVGRCAPSTSGSPRTSSDEGSAKSHRGTDREDVDRAWGITVLTESRAQVAVAAGRRRQSTHIPSTSSGIGPADVVYTRA
jgi:hypothetical protein